MRYAWIMAVLLGAAVLGLAMRGRMHCEDWDTYESKLYPGNGGETFSQPNTLVRHHACGLELH